MPWAAGLVAVCFSAGLGAGAAVVRTAHAQGASPYAGLETLARVLTTVEDRYLEDLPLEAVVHRSLEGLASKLDPWTVYLPPERWRQVHAASVGQATGVGARLERIGDRVVVGRLVPDGPAALAGVQEGDTVDAVDGEPIGDRVDAAAGALQGEIGSTVELTVLRNGTSLTRTLTRDDYLDVPVWGGRSDDGIGWVRIGAFVRGSSGRVDRVLAALEDEGELRGLILDLRDNGGGLLDEATPIADRFLAEGLVVETRGRGDEVLSTFRAGPADTDILDIPLVVLIDGDSASAAEVVSGALQALGRAQLVGTPSYGKGFVQREFLLPEGGALRLTVSRYLLHGERGITRDNPLQPDVSVQRSSRPSPRLRRLRDALRASTPDVDAQEALIADLMATADDDETTPDPPAFAGTLEERARRDPQLARALRLLR